MTQTQPPQIAYLLEAQNRSIGLYGSIDLAKAAAEQAYQKGLAGWTLGAEKYVIKAVRLNAPPERLSLIVLELSPCPQNTAALCEAI